MKTKKSYRTLLLLGTAAVSIFGTMQGFSASYVLVSGGSLSTGAGWQNTATLTTGTVPTSGDTGSIAVDGVFTPATWNTGGASIIQTAGNIVGSGNANFNFVTGTYTMNGGSFSARGILANNSIINLFGGVFTIGNGTSGSGWGAANNGTLNIGGSAVINNSRSTLAGYNSTSGTINFAADWTGSFQNTTANAAAWKTELTTGNYELAGTPITSALFDANFQVTGDTLSLVPEPTSAALLGLGGFALILRRRK
ncbi:PEP-CTERM sorting domain-containing protein [Akkermansiaceae bacterium]|nr:PEP-CTERM sorting domain-containing protein [Akkermansiaceae bacterium]